MKLGRPSPAAPWKNQPGWIRFPWRPLFPLLVWAGFILPIRPATASTPVPYWDLSRDWNPGQITLFNPDSLDGENGVPVKGVDLNGDGRSEVVMSAFNGDGPPRGPFRESAGEIHVFFRDGTPFGQAVDFARRDRRVLEIFGPGPGWYLGDALARGDVDGDGLDDVVVGAFGAGRVGRVHAGMVYVLFGDSTLSGGASIDLSQGLPPGMTSILGSDPDDRLGVWNAVGDVNGDGAPDLVMGADRASGSDGSKPQVGKVVVLYGPIPRGTAVDLADSASWSTTLIWGVDAGDHFGSTTECADLDGDGYGDVIGAASAQGLSRNTYDNGGAADGPPNRYRPASGETWIIWGGPALPDTVDLASPPGGVSTTVVYGRSSGALCGEELSTGDVNGDGLPDLLVGSLTATGPPNDCRINAGEGYVFYGSPALRDTVLDMAVTSYPHLTVYGVTGSIATDSFTAGDVNGDGYDDLLVGMPHDPGPTGRKAGAVGLVYGGPDLPATIDLEAPPTPYTLIEGADHDDDTAYWSSVGDVDGDGLMDPIVNAMSGGGPRNSRFHTGDARIVSGAWLTRHPAPPSSVSVKLLAPGNRAVLAWDASPTPEVTGYRVYQGTDPDRLLPSPEAVVAGTEAQVPGLPPYTPVTFTVRAVIGNVESRSSAPVTAKAGPPPHRLDRPPPGPHLGGRELGTVFRSRHPRLPPLPGDPEGGAPLRGQAPRRERPGHAGDPHGVRLRGHHRSSLQQPRIPGHDGGGALHRVPLFGAGRGLHPAGHGGKRTPPGERLRLVHLLRRPLHELHRRSLRDVRRPGGDRGHPLRLLGHAHRMESLSLRVHAAR
jgi:hypothetical protein